MFLIYLHKFWLCLLECLVEFVCLQSTKTCIVPPLIHYPLCTKYLIHNQSLLKSMLVVSNELLHIAGWMFQFLVCCREYGDSSYNFIHTLEYTVAPVILISSSPVHLTVKHIHKLYISSVPGVSSVPFEKGESVGLHTKNVHVSEKRGF